MQVTVQLEPGPLVDYALEARRESLLPAAHGLSRPDKGAPDKERWVWAEWAYYRGRFAEAASEFGVWATRNVEGVPRSREAMLAILRLGFCHLRLGNILSSRLWLERVAAAGGELAEQFDSHIEELAALHIEAEGTRELARARFLLAYRLAISKNRYRSACTAAAEVSRMHLYEGRPAEALEWLDRAQDLHSRGGTESQRRMLALRRAKLDRLLLRTDQASADLHKLLLVCQDLRTPLVHVGALTALHEIALVKFEDGDLRYGAEAKRHLTLALRIADHAELGTNAIEVLRDRARMLLRLDRRANARAARIAFVEALRRAFRLEYRPRFLLLGLAHDIHHFERELLPSNLHRTKIARSMSVGTRSVGATQAQYPIRVKRARESLERSLRVTPHGQSDRRSHRVDMAEQLEALLRPLVSRRVVLPRGCFEVQGTGKVLAIAHPGKDGSVQSRVLTEAETILFEHQAATGVRPMSYEELAEVLAERLRAKNENEVVGEASTVQRFFVLLSRMARGHVEPPRGRDPRLSPANYEQIKPGTRKGKWKFRMIVKRQELLGDAP